MQNIRKVAGCTVHFWPDTISGRGGGGGGGGGGGERFGALFQFAVIRFSPDTKSGEGGSAS